MKNIILFFDDECLLCNKAVSFIDGHDHNSQFKYSTVNSDFAKKHVPDHVINVDSIILKEDENIFIKYQAVKRILFHLNGWISLLYYPSLLIPNFLGNIFYDFVAKNRYRLFKKIDSCSLMNEDLKKRVYLE